MAVARNCVRVSRWVGTTVANDPLSPTSAYPIPSHSDPACISMETPLRQPRNEAGAWPVTAKVPEKMASPPATAIGSSVVEVGMPETLNAAR